MKNPSQPTTTSTADRVVTARLTRVLQFVLVVLMTLALIQQRLTVRALRPAFEALNPMRTSATNQNAAAGP